MKVSHLTSVHPRYDTRIFLKQCRSLSAAGNKVVLIVADDQPDELKDGVSIVSVGRPRGRADRVFNTTRRIYRKAMELDAEVYHLHDPELLPVGMMLKRRGKRVIFDSHEDVPKQIRGKHYLGRLSSSVISKAVGIYERRSCRQFDAVVAATPYIRDKFLPLNPHTLDINNFPMLGELASDSSAVGERKTDVCYVGGITVARGIREMVQAMELAPNGVRLRLGGAFATEVLSREVRKFPGWKRVDELGWVGREEIAHMLANSVAGLVVLHPIINYVDALPVKMFEYMSAGLPVIASNFPLWREIVEGNQCGLCVDPNDIEAIAGAIRWLIDHPEEARQMGANGKRAVEERYNWCGEEEKLVKLYQQVLR